MRKRKLSRAEALEEYLVYQIRLFEFMHINEIALDIMEGRYQPNNPLGHGPGDFFSTVRSCSYGLFASLMDPQTHALNIFDVWVVLFPSNEQRIVEVWEKVEPHVQLIRAYRNEIAFHANKNFNRYVITRCEFNERRKEIIAAMQEFLALAADLVKSQSSALPHFREDIEPLLRKAFPQKSIGEIEQLKDYFIES